MPHDLLTEDRLTLTELAQELGVNTTTVWRWTQRGSRGIRLETFYVGGRRYTTRQAGRRFSERCTAARSGNAAPSRTPRQREAALARAERECERLGI